MPREQPKKKKTMEKNKMTIKIQIRSHLTLFTTTDDAILLISLSDITLPKGSGADLPERCFLIALRDIMFYCTFGFYESTSTYPSRLLTKMKVTNY